MNMMKDMKTIDESIEINPKSTNHGLLEQNIFMAGGQEGLAEASQQRRAAKQTKRSPNQSKRNK